MGDSYVSEAARWFDAEEAAHEHACLRAAEADGHTTEEAESCEDGEMGCGGCPWKPADP